MAPRKPAAKPKLSSGERAFKQFYGTSLGAVNPKTGKRPTIDPLTAMQAITTAAGYQGVSQPLPVGTPTGNRLGYVNNGVFSFAGRAPGAGPTRGAPKMGQRKGRKQRGAAGAGLDQALAASSPYAEADLATTAYVRQQGKAYAAGRAAGSSLAGQTGKAGAAVAKKKAAGGRKKKGLLKTRGHRQQSGVAPKFHINKQGKVVANKGGRKAKGK